MMLALLEIGVDNSSGGGRDDWQFLWGGYSLGVL
jgi:hypothetical protein